MLKLNPDDRITSQNALLHVNYNIIALFQWFKMMSSITRSLQVQWLLLQWFWNEAKDVKRKGCVQRSLV